MKKEKINFIVNRYLRQVATIFLVSIAVQVHSQDWIWAKSLGGGGNQQARGIGVDSLGFIYVAGMYYDTLLVDTSMFISNGQNDVFLAKLDTNGNTQWIRNFGGTNPDGALTSYTDRNGNTYLAGYAGDLTIIGNDTLPNSDFICKYDDSGSLLWVNYAVSNGGAANILAMDVDDQSNTYVTGYFNGVYAIDGDTLSQISNTGDVFVIKLDSQGNKVWTRNFGSTDIGVNDTEGNAISVDKNGDVLVAGYTEGTIDFDGTTLTGGNQDIIVIKLNSTGNVVFARRYTGSCGGGALSLLASKNGEYYVGGYYCGSFNFGGITHTTPGTFDYDMFIAKYDSSGNALWVKVGNGINGGFVYSIIEGDNNIYAAGMYSGPMTFGTFPLNGGSDPFFAKLDTNGNVLNIAYGVGNGQDQMYDIAYTPKGEIVGAGYYYDSITFGNNYFPPTNFQSNCFVVKHGVPDHKNYIHGKLFWDIDLDCTEDSNYVRLSGKFIHLQPTNNYYLSNDLGEFNLYLDSGQYNLSIINNDTLRSILCPAAPSNYSFSVNKNDSIELDFALKSDYDCPNLTVNIATGQLRPCMQSYYVVNYSNLGTLFEDSVYIEITFDNFVVPISSSFPYTQISTNIYQFWIDSLLPLNQGSFRIDVMVDCNAVLGATQCTKAVIQPIKFCTQSPTWDRSRIIIIKECENDSNACFTIKNVGLNMASPSNYSIFLDNYLINTESFQLNQEDSLIICESTFGKTISLQAFQNPEYPGFEFDQEYIERCGDLPHSLGYILQESQADFDNFKEIDCTEITGSFDPNDKHVSPTGLTTNHYIDSITPLEYRINFQNTGTDTAFKVVIIDTISPYLNPELVNSLISSHAYDLTIMEGNILKFKFENILLPDSNINESESHGFVKFKISQTVGNINGSIITNNAAIYFDFNDPIKTNTTLNTVFDTMLVNSLTQNHKVNKYSIELFPNPSSGFVTVLILQPCTLTIINSFGQIIETKKLNDNQETIDLNHYKNGIYLLEFDFGRDKELRKIILK